MFGTTVERLATELGEALEGFDVAVVEPREAAALVPVVEQLVRRATAARTLLVGRAAESNDFDGGVRGPRSAVGWAARATGVSPRQAMRELQAAQRLREASGTQSAFLAGDLSAEQAARIAEAAAISPGSEAELLTTARERPQEVEGRCRHIKAHAAGREAQAARQERHRRARRLVRGEDDDLAATVSMVMPGVLGARFDQLLAPFVQQVVDRARVEGRFEPMAAHRLDGIFLALESANGTADIAGSPDAAGDGRVPVRGRGKGSGRTRRLPQPKVIVRVDAAAVARGHALDGERLDLQVDGHPPVPIGVDELGRILTDDDPLVAVVATDGIDVTHVVHLRHDPTPEQATALDWLHDRCANPACDAWGPLETHHEPPYALSRHTRLDELVRLHGDCHDHATTGGATYQRIAHTPHWQPVTPDDPRHPCHPHHRLRPPTAGRSPAPTARPETSTPTGQAALPLDPPGDPPRRHAT